MGASSFSTPPGQSAKAATLIPKPAGRPRAGSVTALATAEPAYRIVLMAVEALDELVADMIRQNHGKIPRDFFDWIADEMTPRLEIMAFAHFVDHGWPGMAAESATRNWVRTTCQVPIEQKLKGMGFHTDRQTLDSPVPKRPSRGD